MGEYRDIEIIHRINNFLAFGCTVLGVIIFVLPYLPSISFFASQKAGLPVPAYANPDPQVEVTVPTDNRLAIPVIGIDEPILEGESDNTVNQGLWRRPKSAKPFDNNNTVIVGHRFTYSPSVRDPFYNLDKVKVGDKIVMAWEGRRINYTVTETLVVPATALEIEASTDTPMLTLYTCTPLWTSRDRLVVRAVPVTQGNQ